MFESGDLCMKLAGKDAGKTVVIVEKLDHNFVVIDGPVKRKRCNIGHLELLNKKVEVKKGASHEDIVKAMQKVGVIIPHRKQKQAAPKPTRQKKSAAEPAKEDKPKKAPPKKGA